MTESSITRWLNQELFHDTRSLTNSVSLVVFLVHSNTSITYSFVPFCVFFFNSLGVINEGVVVYVLYLDNNKGYFVTYSCNGDPNSGTYRGKQLIYYHFNCF